MKYICIVPARGGSKRLPRKNLYPVCGKPMIEWAIEACLDSNFLSNCDIYVSTEDSEIIEHAQKKGVRIIERPKELAEDHVWTQDVLKHALDTLPSSENYDIVVRVQANSPQVTGKKIDECIQKLLDHNLWEVFTVNESGIEDAAIHVMLSKCVYQNALSVYKGVVCTNYLDVHDIIDVKMLEQKMKE